MDLSKLLEGAILVGSFLAASVLEAGRAAPPSAPATRRVPPPKPAPRIPTAPRKPAEKPSKPSEKPRALHLESFLDIRALCVAVYGAARRWNEPIINKFIYYDRVVIETWLDGVLAGRRVIRVPPGKYLRWLDPDTIGCETRIEEIGEKPDWSYRDFVMRATGVVARGGYAVFRVVLVDRAGLPIGVRYRGRLLAWLEPGEEKVLWMRFSLGV